VPLGYRTEVVCGGAELKSDSNKGTPVILVRIQVPQPTADAAAAGAQGGRVACAGIHMSDIRAIRIGCSGKSGGSCRSPISIK